MTGPDRLPARLPTTRVDSLSDDDLRRLNDLLPWQCFTLDAHGRRIGKPASRLKRATPQTIPDRRIVELDRRLPLAGLSVLEVGCFEAIHTIALLSLGAKVTAVDARVENVAKTVTRLWAYGLQADVSVCDVEQAEAYAQLPDVDVTHHMGVLYHLVDPVRHLRQVLAKTRRGLLLDTHYSMPQEATATYESEGRMYAYRRLREYGRKAAFAGMYDHAKWLPLDTLVAILQEGGFARVDVAERRDERNGPRTLIYALRD